MVLDKSLAEGKARRGIKNTKSRISDLFDGADIRAKKPATRFRKMCELFVRAWSDNILCHWQTGKKKHAVQHWIVLDPLFGTTNRMVTLVWLNAHLLDFGSIQLFKVSNHAIARINQAALGNEELEKPGSNFISEELRLSKICGNNNACYVEQLTKEGKNRLLTEHGYLVLEADNDGYMVAVTWIPDVSMNTPKRVIVESARREGLAWVL